MVGAQITLKDLTAGYGRHPAVHHLSGHFAAGSLTAVAGPNGAGKSTLLKVLVGLLRPLSGQVDWHDTHLCDVAYLPQADQINTDIPITLIDFLATAHWPRGHKPTPNLTPTEALAKVGLTGFGQRTINQLSTGQFRRLLFARILLIDSPLILLDEPFAGVDAETTARLLHVIAHWHAEGRTTIAVLHDFEMIRRHFPSCLLLARDAIGWGAPTDVLTQPNLERAYSFDGNWGDAALVCTR